MEIRMDISIQDGISPDIERKLDALKNTRPLMRAIAEAMEQTMRAHYLSQPPNALGFPSQGFWRKEGADRVIIESFDQTQATVVVDSVAMGHRFFGGRVSAKGAGALSIPVSPEAYATGSASLWSGPELTLIPRQDKPALLVDVSDETAWNIHYVLVKSVVHEPDERAFAPRETVESSVHQVIRDKLDLLLRIDAMA